jgi:EAL domain-containing protein (putative c-di-GMP-specific phosphodiesterase class I)
MMTRFDAGRASEAPPLATGAVPVTVARAQLGDVLAQAAIDIGYQPVVDLDTREIVGYEALARGPRGGALESPDVLFAAARAAGRLDELDWMCQRQALMGALKAGLQAPHVLFLNVEPDTSGFMPLELRSLYARATSQMTVAVEVTERALTERPAALLGHVADMRAVGCAVALDDVGTEAGSLAMMAVLAPEVIKFDLQLVAGSADADIADVVNAVTAQAEHSNATILVERIETEADAQFAEALGARLAQGWLYGRRGPLTHAPPRPSSPVSVAATSRLDPRDTTPFALVSGARRVRRTGRALVDAMTHQLEEHARAAGDGAVLLSAFKHASAFSPDARARYAGLARSVAFCGVLGQDMPSEPAHGVRGALVHATDPLRLEWTVAVVSPHFAAALTAYDLGEEAPEDRRYEFVLTYDRELAVGAAASLMARVPR